MAFIMNVKILKKPNVQKWMMIGIFALLLITLVIGKILMVQKVGSI